MKKVVNVLTEFGQISERDSVSLPSMDIEVVLLRNVRTPNEIWQAFIDQVCAGRHENLI